VEQKVNVVSLYRTKKRILWETSALNPVNLNLMPVHKDIHVKHLKTPIVEVVSHYA